MDDFFFAALWKFLCDGQLESFINVCQEISFPVALDKTFWGTTQLVFLGLLLDSERQLVCVPAEKVSKALDMIDFFLDKNWKNATLLQLQQLCGYLNFLCRCILPGRAFLMRLYSLTTGPKLKPHHHIRIKEENRLDLGVWKEFLSSAVFSRSFMEIDPVQTSEIDMYSDASGKIGFGAYCQYDWMAGTWGDFLQFKPSIEYLELYAVTAGILQWIELFANRRVILFCDNMGVVHMINNPSFKCKNCMILIRLIMLHCMKVNVRVFAKYVNMKDNVLADSLSRADYTRFRKAGPHMCDKLTPIPAAIWPPSSIWLKS